MTVLWQQKTISDKATKSNVSAWKTVSENRKRAVKWSNVSRRNHFMPSAPMEQENKQINEELSDVLFKVQWW